MKIALCFSGQPRDLKECHENINKNLIDGYDVDVYAHAWWSEDMAGTEYKPNSVKFLEKADEEFAKLYKPKKSVFENQIKFDTSSCNHYNLGVCVWLSDLKKCYFNMKSAYYSMAKSFELALSSNESYDFYVRCRTDLLFPKKLKYEELNSDTLYIGDGRTAGWDRFFSDWFACGSKANIQKYCQIYEKFDSYVEKGFPHMHDLFRLHLEDTKCDTYAIAPEIYYLMPKKDEFVNLDGMPRRIFFDKR